MVGETEVAVVDDDADVRRGMDRLLRSIGYRVSTFASAEEFLESGSLANWFCIILDVHLGGMSGPNLHERLHAMGITRPTVFVTADRNVAAGNNGHASAGTRYLVKPVDEEALLEAIAVAGSFA